MPRPLRVFISYSHRNEAHCDRLRVHLKLLQRQGLIEQWHDRLIQPGADRANEIDAQLDAADLVLLLVSADFLASDYCFEKELLRAIERHAAGETQVVPIVVEPVDFEAAPFARFEPLPRDARPISTWPNAEEAWDNVARGLRKMVESMQARVASAAPRMSAAAQPAPSPSPSEVRLLPSPAEVTLLFLGADPTDTVRIQLGRESRQIEDRLRQSAGGRRFKLVQEWAVGIDALQAALLEHRPTIVHFSGHGSEAGELLVEDSAGKSQPIPIHALADLFRILKGAIRCVVLNACFSRDQADAIRRHIDFVVGMKDAIEDEAAIAFASSFYLALGHDQTFETAFALGCNQIDLRGLASGDAPVLLRREDPSEPSSPASEPRRRATDHAANTVLRRNPPRALQPAGGPYHPEWYVRRAPQEKRAANCLELPGLPVVLCGPALYGKTFVLKHLLATARQSDEQQGKHSRFVVINLDKFEQRSMASLDALLREIAAQVIETLDLQPELVETAWQRPSSAARRMSWLMERHVLPLAEGGRLFVAIERCDALLPHPYRDELFGLLRAWSQDADNPLWSRLRLLLAVSTTPMLLLKGVDRSPLFNIVEEIAIGDFDARQAQELAALYDLPWSAGDVAGVMSRIGGHPYLLRVAMYQSALEGWTPEALVREIDRDGGVFHAHLARWFKDLPADLLADIGRLLAEPSAEIAAGSKQRLFEAGLTVQRAGGAQSLRNALYEQYFRKVCRAP